MNLLFLTHHIPERVTFRAGAFARIMAGRGHQVTVVNISSSNRWQGVHRKEDGILWVETPDILPGKLRSGWDPRDTFWRTRHLRDIWESSDLVHLFETRPVSIFPALILQKKCPKPWVIDWNDWWGRGGLITELRPRWYQALFGGMETWFEEKFRIRAHATTIISEGLRPRALGLGVPKASIFKVTGSAQTDHFTVVPPRTHRAAFNLPLDGILVGYAGLDAHIDLPLALEAFRIARRQRENLNLLLIGGASLPEPEPGIFPLGRLEWDRLPMVLSCADLFILPFRDKPANRGRWPNKVMDYLACGRPVLTNPTGEMLQVFHDGRAGHLVPETPEDLATALVKLADQPNQRDEMGRHARWLAENAFQPATLAEQLQNAYRFAIKHGPRQPN